MSPPSLDEIIYEQAQKALEQQERQVNELRQRTGTLLAAAALTASFFGAAAVGHDGIVAPVVLAAVALVVTVLSGLYVLYPHRLEFSADARRLYDDLARDREHPESLLVRVAFGFRDTRERNGRVVDRIALVVQIAFWTWALALL
jgi:hypothetical protein